MQSQIEKKDAEINEITTKYNEKVTEFQSLQSDKQVIEEQLRDCKYMSNLVPKNPENDKRQQDFEEQKKFHEQQLNELKQQIEFYKQKLNQSQNNQQQIPIVSNERLQPLSSVNQTIQNPSANLSDGVIPIQTNNIQQLDQNVAGQGQNNPNVQQQPLQPVLMNLAVDNQLPNQAQPVIENVQNPANLANNQAQLLPDNQINREQIPLVNNDGRQNNPDKRGDEDQEEVGANKAA